MERPNSTSSQSVRIERQLAHLKILSRLLGHELHAQTGPKVTLSRDELKEIQTSVDLFIEEFLHQRGGNALTEVDVQPAPARLS